MTVMLACCGLNCAECPAYLAKLNDDDEQRLSALEKWSTPDYPLTKEDINCDECKSEGGAHFKFCDTCSVRKCVIEKGVETCAHCDDYICNTLEEWLSHAGDGPREILEKLRAAL